MGSESQSEDNKDLRKIIDVLTGEYANLRWIWQEFLELYARDGARIERMNDVAPGFFGLVQSLMIEAMVIRLCRITDGAGTGKRTNLPLRCILSALPPEMSQHEDDLKGMILNAETLVDRVRPWRNKRLAHLDYDHAMSENHQKFSIGYTEIRKSIEAIHAVLDRTSVIAWDTAISPEFFPAPGTASSLISVLMETRKES